MKGWPSFIASTRIHRYSVTGFDVITTMRETAMSGKVNHFQVLWDGESQDVPAIDDKGTATVTMPGTASPGDQYILEALAKDDSNRTIGRASKTITAVAPAVERPQILSPANSSYVLNDYTKVELKPLVYTPGYLGVHKRTTYQVALDRAFTALLADVTTTTDLLSTALKLSRPLAQKEGAFIRVRVEEETLGWSDWSDTHSVAGTMPQAPATVRPKQGAVVPYKAIAAVTESMTCLGGVLDTHVSTDWKLTDLTGTITYAASLNDTVNLTSFTFAEGIPPDTYVRLHVRHSGEISGTGLWTSLTVKVSEPEVPLAPVITFPRDYCHPKNISVILNKLEVRNMPDAVCVGAQYRIVRDVLGADVIYDSGEVSNCTRLDISLDTPLTPGEAVYIQARQKEELVGWTPWNVPAGLLAAKTATPSFIFPKDGGQVFATDFTMSISEFRTQGLTTDTHESTDWEIFDDSSEVKLFSSYADTTNLTSIGVALPEELMGAHVRLRVRVKGVYTGYSAWVSARVLIHLPMVVLPPTIVKPAEDTFIGLRGIAVETSPFSTENVDVPNHEATLIRVTYDAAGAQTAFLSSDITTGDKTKYVINFGTPPTSSTLFVSARHKDKVAGWSEWGAPTRLRVALPVAPVIVSPADGELIGFDDITLKVTGYALDGGVTGLPHAATHVVLKDAETGVVYLDFVTDGPLTSIKLPGKQDFVNRHVKLGVSFVGTDVGEGATSEIALKIRRISQGVRIGGGATVVGMADGSPFTIKGRKLFIAVADSAFRVAGGVVWGVDNTLLDDVPYSLGGLERLPIPSMPDTIAPQITERTTEAMMDATFPAEHRDSRHNTHVTTVWNPGEAAQKAAGVSVAGLDFELPNIDALLRVLWRGEYIDAHEVQTGLHVFESDTGGYLWSSTESSTTAACAGLPYTKGALVPDKTGNFALIDTKPGVCPVFELPYEGLEYENVVLPAPEIITYGTAGVNRDIPVSIRASIMPADAKISKIIVDVDNKGAQEFPVRNGYTHITLRFTEAAEVTVTAKAVSADGAESPTATLVISVAEIKPQTPTVAIASYIQAVKVVFTSSAFTPMTGQNVTHRGTQYQLLSAATGGDVLYDSGESQQLLRHTATLLTPLSPRATVFARIRHYGSDGVPSSWSAPVSTTVTYPLPPVVSTPTDGSTANLAMAAMAWSDANMAGGVGQRNGADVGGSDTEHPYETVNSPVVFKRELTSLDGKTIYFSDTVEWADNGNLSVLFRATEFPRGERLKLRIRKEFGYYGESDWVTLEVVASETRVGERVCGIATIVGHADGTPFTNAAGDKFWIAIPDEEHWLMFKGGAGVLPSRQANAETHIFRPYPVPTPLTDGAEKVYAADGGYPDNLTRIAEQFVRDASHELVTRAQPTVLDNLYTAALAVGCVYSQQQEIYPRAGAAAIAHAGTLGCENVKFYVPNVPDALLAAAAYPLLVKLRGGTESQVNLAGISMLTTGLVSFAQKDSVFPADTNKQRTYPVGGAYYRDRYGADPLQVASRGRSFYNTQTKKTEYSYELECEHRATGVAQVIPIAIIPYADSDADGLFVNMSASPQPMGGSGPKKDAIQQVLTTSGPLRKTVKAYPTSLISLTNGSKPVDDRLYLVSCPSLASGDPTSSLYDPAEPRFLYYKDKYFWIHNTAYASRIATLTGEAYNKYVAAHMYDEVWAYLQLGPNGIVPIQVAQSVDIMPNYGYIGTPQRNIRLTRLMWSKLKIGFSYTGVQLPAPRNVAGHTYYVDATYAAQISAIEDLFGNVGAGGSLNIVERYGPRTQMLLASAEALCKYGKPGAGANPDYGSSKFYLLQGEGLSTAHPDDKELQTYYKKQNSPFAPEVLTIQATRYGNVAQVLGYACNAYDSMVPGATMRGNPPAITAIGFRYDPDDPFGEIPDADYNY